MRNHDPFSTAESQPWNQSGATLADKALSWAIRIASCVGLILTLWAGFSTGSMLVHGHPAYAIVLAAVFLASLAAAVDAWRKPAATHRKLKVLRWAVLAPFAGVVALSLWFVPFSAEEPALAAMRSGATVTVTETATQIVMSPSGVPSPVGLFFQPGALVDARAYAAVLRPLAEHGHIVVIPKQPLCIAFLSTGSFSAARGNHPPVDRWVVGGHSLGGVVSSMDAQSFSTVTAEPVVGVLFYASYPSNAMKGLDAEVLSVSASNDGLATPAKIAASKALLPQNTVFRVIDGAVHADFGDYGSQPGDGEPTVTRNQARSAIINATVDFMDSFGP